MSARVSPERRHEAIEQASMWLEKLERTLKPAESASLREWLQEPLHRQVIVERCRLWHGPEILGLLRALIRIDPPPPRKVSREGQIIVGIFIAVWGMSIFAFVFARAQRGSDNAALNSLRAEQVHRTSANERRHIELPDGSTMSLNHATHVLVSFGPRARDVTLLSGEAIFAVIADPDRPFRVSAGSRRMEVIAQHSRFGVRHAANDEVELVVTDGQVRALDSRRSRPLTPTQLRQRFSHGDHAFVASEVGVLGPGWHQAWMADSAEIRQRLTWSEAVVEQRVDAETAFDPQSGRRDESATGSQFQ